MNDQDDESSSRDSRMEESHRLKQLAALLGTVGSTSVTIDGLRRELDLAALEARELGATWTQLAKAAGISAPSAQRRWDPESRERHRNYQRDRFRSRPALEKTALSDHEGVLDGA